MVKLNKIYTRGGDKGQTSLVGQKRVAKHDARVAAYGTVDETNAAIGVARLHTQGEADTMLARIQDDLFDLGADLANVRDDSVKEALRIVPEQVARLEREIDSPRIVRLAGRDAGGCRAACRAHRMPPR